MICDEAHSSQSGEAAKDLKAVLSGRTGEDALYAAEAAEGAAAGSGALDFEDLLANSVAARGGGRRTCRSSRSRRHPSTTGSRTVWVPARDPELPKGKGASELARWVSQHPSNIAHRSQIIVEHFRHRTAAKIGGHAKAMVVTASRLHAIRYYQAITGYIKDKGYDRGAGAVRVLVAFSGKVTDPDNERVEYRESLMNGFPESQPHHGRQVRHVRPGLRQRCRGHRRGVRAVLRPDDRVTNRSQHPVQPAGPDHGRCGRGRHRDGSRASRRSCAGAPSGRRS